MVPQAPHSFKVQSAQGLNADGDCFPPCLGTGPNIKWSQLLVLLPIQLSTTIWAVREGLDAKKKKKTVHQHRPTWEKGDKAFVSVRQWLEQQVPLSLSHALSLSISPTLFLPHSLSLSTMRHTARYSMKKDWNSKRMEVTSSTERDSGT